MQIWVDADACPVVIKEIIFRAAKRTKTYVILVSNHVISAPNSPFIKKIQVMRGFDMADHKIVQQIEEGDIVITADIPLAAAVVVKNAFALNPRGEFYDKKNVKQRLSQRDIGEAIRSSGGITAGPAKMSKREIGRFANQLDVFLQSK